MYLHFYENDVIEQCADVKAIAEQKRKKVAVKMDSADKNLRKTW